jgi:hypothetical protein
MAHSKYYKRSESRDLEISSLMTQRQIYNRKPEGILFYELEPAVVIDVIRDETHPIFKKKTGSPHINKTDWPTGYNDPETLDYSWVGRIMAREIYSQTSVPINELGWIIPLESGVVEYPLVNELVIVIDYMGSKYYTRRLNTRNFINNSADFRYEHQYGKKGGISSQTSNNLVGARNVSDLGSETAKYGSYLGKYFKANNKIRPLKHFEGDTVYESRFGNSIRFGCYVDDPILDRGTSRGHGESYDGNLGNPMILIRNRQHITTEDETKFQYNILEDINRDGSSIHITSGNTKSEFLSTTNHSYDNISYGCLGCRIGGFSGLYSLSKSIIGSNKIKSVEDDDTQGSQGGTALPTELDMSSAMSTNPTADMLPSPINPYSAISGSLTKGDFGGAIGSALGAAVGGSLGAKMGQRMGGIGLKSVNKFISAPGSPTSRTPSQRKKFVKSIASGNFSLKPEYERGIVSSTTKAREVGKSKLMSSPIGSAVSAATSLGIGVPGLDGLGITSNDSAMFKIFKLAAFGIKSICGSLKNKRGHGSKTEEKLGWLLSLGIDLALLALLKALFDRLRGLKFNFGSFRAPNLNDLLRDLCDWINQIEYKSTLLETFRNEANKELTDGELTKQLGDGFINDGTYETYARNHPDFDRNYRGLTGDVDAILAAGKTFGQPTVSLKHGGEEKARVRFDPLTGLFRHKEPTGSPTHISLTPDLSLAAVGLATTSSTTTSTTSNVSNEIPVQESSPTGISSNRTSRPSVSVGGVELPFGQSVVSLPTVSNKSSTPNQQSKTRPTTPPNIKSAIPTASKTVSFMSGKEITRDSLKGTILESADLNAVALLDEEDLEVLKDTPKIVANISAAKKAHDDKFDEEMTKVEKSILEKTDGDAIFGKQLPELTGNQIIINSERVLISSKTQETGIFSKKKFFVTTDDEITLDAKGQIVMRTDAHMSMVSPSVHLGLHTSECHPTLKGDCTTAWLSELCGWLSSHVHHDPYITTSRPAQQGHLASLRARLPTLLSERIFISG